jgi:putative SOS response-associated peptidase YedK
MCGRVNVSSGPLTLLFMDMVGQPYPKISRDTAPGEDRFNVAPTEPVPVLRAGRIGLESAPMRWWLTPYWSNGPSTQYSMFNAKAETLQTSRAFKEPFARRRCLVPVCGYYEWAKQGDRKLPYYIRPTADDGLLLAGIWDRWRNGDETIESFAVVTTAVHERLAFVHSRQPAMLSRSEGQRWIDRDEKPAVLQAELLAARVPVHLSVIEVSTYVNNSRNEGQRCIEPIGRTIEVDVEA